MVKSEKKRCTFVDEDGKKCNRWATELTDYKYCWFHDPKIEPEEKHDARSKGGKRGATKTRKVERIFEDITEMPLETINDVEEIMKVVIMNMAAGHISEQFGKTLMDALKSLFSVMEKTGDWHKKLKELMKDA